MENLKQFLYQMFRAKSKRTIALILILLLNSLSFSSCTRSTSPTHPGPPTTSAQRVANALLNLATAVGDVNTAVIKANVQHLLTDQQTRAILSVSDRIALAGKEATAITAGLVQLDPNNKTKLLAVFTPIIAAVDDSLTNGLVTIQDQNTVSTIRAILLGIQTTLSSVRLALQGAN